MKKTAIRSALALCLVFATIALGACSSGSKYAEWQGEEPFQAEDLSKSVTLGEYKGVAVQLPSNEITDEQVMEVAKRGLLSKSDKTVVENGDIILFDFEGTAPGLSEEVLQGMKAEKYSITVGSGAFIPGFEEQMVGKTVGEKFDVKVTFPADYNSPELAGKDATFHCLVHEIQVVDLTDAKVKEATAGATETLEALYAEIRADLAQTVQANNFEQSMSMAIQTAYENAKVTEVPEREMEMYREQLKEQAVANEHKDEMAYLEASGYTLEQWTSETETRLRQEMFVYAVAQKEGLVITEKELNDYVKEQSADADPALSEKEALAQMGGKNMLMRGLTQDKVMTFIYENAKKTEVPAAAQ